MCLKPNAKFTNFFRHTDEKMKDALQSSLKTLSNKPAIQLWTKTDDRNLEHLAETIAETTEIQEASEVEERLIDYFQQLVDWKTNGIFKNYQEYIRRLTAWFHNFFVPLLFVSFRDTFPYLFNLCIKIVIGFVFTL